MWCVLPSVFPRLTWDRTGASPGTSWDAAKTSRAPASPSAIPPHPVSVWFFEYGSQPRSIILCTLHATSQQLSVAADAVTTRTSKHDVHLHTGTSDDTSCVADSTAPMSADVRSPAGSMTPTSIPHHPKTCACGHPNVHVLWQVPGPPLSRLVYLDPPALPDPPVDHPASERPCRVAPLPHRKLRRRVCRSPKPAVEEICHRTLRWRMRQAWPSEEASQV